MINFAERQELLMDIFEHWVILSQSYLISRLKKNEKIIMQQFLILYCQVNTENHSSDCRVTDVSTEIAKKHRMD